VDGGGAVGAPFHCHRNGRSSLGMAAANADGLLIANKMMPTATARQTTTIPMPMARAMIKSASGGIEQLGGQRTPSGPTWGGLYLRLPGWCREAVRHGDAKQNRQVWLLRHPIRNALQPTDAVMVGPTDRFVEGHVPRRRSNMDDTHHRSSMQQVVSCEPYSHHERSATPSPPMVPCSESPTVGGRRYGEGLGRRWGARSALPSWLLTRLPLRWFSTHREGTGGLTVLNDGGRTANRRFPTSLCSTWRDGRSGVAAVDRADSSDVPLFVY
jgi:hypothetical protein